MVEVEGEVDVDADDERDGRMLGGGVGCDAVAEVLKKESLSEREVEGGDGEDGRRGVVSGSPCSLVVVTFTFDC